MLPSIDSYRLPTDRRGSHMIFFSGSLLFLNINYYGGKGVIIDFSGPVRVY